MINELIRSMILNIIKDQLHARIGITPEDGDRIRDVTIVKVIGGKTEMMNLGTPREHGMRVVQLPRQDPAQMMWLHQWVLRYRRRLRVLLKRNEDS